jgi:hypothetical protein
MAEVGHLTRSRWPCGDRERLFSVLASSGHPNPTPWTTASQFLATPRNSAKKSLPETIQLHPNSRPFAHVLIGTRSSATSRRCQQPRCGSGSQRTAHKRSATNKIASFQRSSCAMRCTAPSGGSCSSPSRRGRPVAHPKSRMGAGLPSCARHLHALRTLARHTHHQRPQRFGSRCEFEEAPAAAGISRSIFAGGMMRSLN